MQNTLLNNAEPIEKEGYLNNVQMLVLAVCARTTVLKWGRRTGKTSRAVALYIMRCVAKMPRSAGFFSGANLQKILGHMLPEVLAAFEYFGWEKERDFVVGKRPPAHFAKPFVSPESWNYVVAFANGSIINLIGFDHKSTSNALAHYWGVIDEAKQVPEERIKKELLPTMSGNHLLFGQLPEHLSLMICSDGNIGAKDSDWIEQYAESASTPAQVKEILLLQKAVERCQDPVTRYQLTQELLDKQRKATLYIEASTIENLAVLGIDFFRAQSKNLDAIEFMESILNQKATKIKGGFYALLDEITHGYSAPNYAHIDTIGIGEYVDGQTCLADADCRPDIGLKVSIDFGSRNNWLVVNQFYGNKYFALRNIFVQSPYKISDLLAKFNKVYAPHKKRVIELYYDVAGDKETTRSVTTDAEEVTRLLRAAGWEVINKVKGKDYINHHDKFRIWEKILGMVRKTSTGKAIPEFRYNTDNAYELFYSMSRAKAKPGMKREIQKDKSSERNDKIEQWMATHLSDAQDNIVCYDNVHLLDRKTAPLRF